MELCGKGGGYNPSLTYRSLSIIKSPVPGMGYLFLSCWSVGSHRYSNKLIPKFLYSYPQISAPLNPHERSFFFIVEGTQ